MPAPGHEPFLRAICAAPDDDAPRLVYADWLDERGQDDRAEFLRLHIYLARHPDAAGTEARCESLLQDRWRPWLAQLPGTTAVWAEFSVSQRPAAGATPVHLEDEAVLLDAWLKCTPELRDWDRGFPATVYVQGSSDVFYACARAIQDHVPVRRLRVTKLDRDDPIIGSLADVPLLSGLRELVVQSTALPDETGVALANSPAAAGLRLISLAADRLTDRAGRAFAESPNLTRVETLQLIRNRFSDRVRARLRARFGHRVHC